MEQKELKGYLEKGSDISGSVLGAAIGLIGGPIATIVGAGIGSVISIGLKEITMRSLSNREEVRTAASVTYILTGIAQRVKDGDEVRTDDFFSDVHGRSSAEELFEGVLMKCKDQYQEKKIPYVSKIFEKAAFDSNISAAMANQLLILAEGFTYHKFCVIAFFGRKEEFDTELLMREPYSWYHTAKVSIDIEILQQDIFDLSNLGIIDKQNHMLVTKEHIIPEKFGLTTIGKAIFTSLGLDLMPKDEIDLIFSNLQYKDEFGLSEQGKRNGFN